MSWPHFLAAPRLRQGVKSLALALLMAGITSTAIRVFGWRWPRTSRAGVSAAGKPRAFDLAHDQRLVPVAPEAEVTGRTEESAPSASAHRNLSASEMFEAAKLARQRGDTAEALRLSLQIEQFFPNSPEGIDTHLALGVLYLQKADASAALREFAMFRRIGSPELKAEAYWGQAQALRQLSRSEDEQIVLEALSQDYPRSAYVAAARARLAEVARDASVH